MQTMAEWIGGSPDGVPEPTGSDVYGYAGDYDGDRVQLLSFAGVRAVEVDTVIWSVDGERDGDEWVALFRMTDGGYVLAFAGCDYTGWDCQAGGGQARAQDLEHALSPAFMEAKHIARDPHGWIAAREEALARWGV